MATETKADIAFTYTTPTVSKSVSHTNSREIVEPSVVDYVVAVTDVATGVDLDFLGVSFGGLVYAENLSDVEGEIIRIGRNSGEFMVMMLPGDIAIFRINPDSWPLFVHIADEFSDATMLRLIIFPQGS